jgi:hypothetical protein
VAWEHLGEVCLRRCVLTVSAHADGDGVALRCPGAGAHAVDELSDLSHMRLRRGDQHALPDRLLGANLGVSNERLAQPGPADAFELRSRGDRNLESCDAVPEASLQAHHLCAEVLVQRPPEKRDRQAPARFGGPAVIGGAPRLQRPVGMTSADLACRARRDASRDGLDIPLATQRSSRRAC